MPNADLTRRMRPCPTCGGSGEERKQFLLHSGFWTDAGKCSTCHGSKTIPAETPEEYAARLRALVEEARAERNKWTAMAEYLAEHLHGQDSDEWLAEAARAVAGKDGV
jgi:mono/diheme cytochrome c family protein